MDRKPIFLYLPMKWMALDAIHDDLVRTLGKDAVTYSTVTKYARSAQFSGRKEATPPEAPDAELSPVDEAILTALAEFPFPFSSVHLHFLMNSQLYFVFLDSLSFRATEWP
jgi:hypothetical protein